MTISFQLDLDPVARLANVHAPSDPGDRNRVTNGVHRDITFRVGGAPVQPIHFRDPCRQRFQVQSFDGEQLSRHGAKMLLISGVHLVAPLARLKVEILPAGEGTARQKVVFDE
jgi:hypothetical protein